jgi:putative glutamine amidotransferase
MSVEPDPERDALELPLARDAVARDLPVFAICRGIQTLNVALGGTLIQDVDVERTGAQRWSHQQRKSRPDAPLHAAVHEIAIAPGTKLHGVAGADVIGVNTFHHQALKDVAPELIVTARSIEGEAPPLIEAVEAPGRRFVLGVQWHPERMWKQDAACARLFEALVRAAAERRRAGALRNRVGSAEPRG